MNDLTCSQPHSLSIYSQAAVQLIKDTVCRGASDQELKLFIEVCKRTHLDPFTKQIYAIKRYDSTLQREVMSTQISIDGLRVIAERSGKYQGQEGPYWCGEDGVWVDCWLKDTPPVAAKVGVLRSDFKEPLFATAKFKVYVQKKRDGTATKFWGTMPDVMIAKVAEALALRKAFPNAHGEFYFSDEGQKIADLTQAHVEKIAAVFAKPRGDAQEAADAALESLEGDCSPPNIEPVLEAVAPKSDPVAKQDHPVELDMFDGYTVPFGKKYFGRTLKDIGLRDAMSYAKWLKEKAQASKQTLQGSALSYCSMVEHFEEWTKQQQGS